MAVLGVAGAHAGLAADVAPEVLGLGERALRAGARDLERVLLADVRQMVGDALAEIQRDALRMVDEEAHEITSDHLGEQDLNLGFRLCQVGLDVGLDVAHVTSSSNKKAGSSPASTWP